MSPISRKDILNYPAVRAIIDPCARAFADELGISGEALCALNHGIIDVKEPDGKHKEIAGIIKTTIVSCPRSSVEYMTKKLEAALWQYIADRKIPWTVGKTEIQFGACDADTDLVTLIQSDDLQPVASREEADESEVSAEGEDADSVAEEDDLEEDEGIAEAQEEYEHEQRDAFEKLSVIFDQTHAQFMRDLSRLYDYIMKEHLDSDDISILERDIPYLEGINVQLRNLERDLLSISDEIDDLDWRSGQKTPEDLEASFALNKAILESLRHRVNEYHLCDRASDKKVAAWKTSSPHGGRDTQPIGRHVDIYPVDSRGKRVRGIKKGKVSFDETKPKVDGVKEPPKPKGTHSGGHR